MPKETVMVSTCPLCAGPEEVLSMIAVQIDRIIPKGRAAIVICRICAGAVVEAVGKADPPLLSTLIYDSTPPTEAPWSSDTWSAAAAIYGAFGDDPAWLEDQLAREKKEPDDAACDQKPSGARDY